MYAVYYCSKVVSSVVSSPPEFSSVYPTHSLVLYTRAGSVMQFSVTEIRQQKADRLHWTSQCSIQDDCGTILHLGYMFQVLVLTAKNIILGIITKKTQRNCRLTWYHSCTVKLLIALTFWIAKARTEASLLTGWRIRTGAAPDIFQTTKYSSSGVAQTNSPST